MLRKKMFRDIKNNKSQFFTIFLMVLIGVMVYVGIESYMSGMQNTSDTFYEDYNLQDINVLGTSFTEDDLDTVKSIDNVNDAELKLVLNATNGDDADKGYLVSFIESNNISKFYVEDGEKFDVNEKGAWLDYYYAKENNIKVGDKISIKYDSFVLDEEVKGLIYVPDHLYDVKDSSALMPDKETYGFVYLSVNEFPQDYMNGIIPYNYIMVDINNKNNNTKVKNEIETKLSNALAETDIEDSSSYIMYQGEIDEGKAYVGIFSGLFIFIALLSVITTMTRIVKKQKLQIGTLKALGFSNFKILMHYVGYGFWLSLFGSLSGLILGRYLFGKLFLNMELAVFEAPNGHPILEAKCYLVSILVVLLVSFITYLTVRKELKKTPAEALRNELPNVKTNSLNITSKGLFKKMNFSNKWNFRDVLRNKFRTITGIVGVTGCCMLIVCALGMLNSMNHFITLQFDELYNFEYKLTLNENISEEDINKLTDEYGDNTSMTLGIEIKDEDGNRESNNVFVYDANNLIRFQDNANNYIKVDKDNGVYVTYKLAEENNYKIGDVIKWHVYGSNKYYETKIVGFNKDPQNQNITITKKYAEKLGITYLADSIYTNDDLSDIKEINNVESIQNINNLKDNINSMLSMMKSMIIIIIVFAVILGAIIIYNMGILSYSEKQYQFATLKVLGFKDKTIKKIFIKQNNWIAILSIILGLPLGYYLTSWLFKACLDDNFDFGVYINISTYILAAIGTYLVSYVFSNLLAKKINDIDMVSSLKGNE